MPPPITPKGPMNVSGEWNLIQALNGPQDEQTKETRGYENAPPGIANDNDDVGVDVALSGPLRWECAQHTVWFNHLA